MEKILVTGGTGFIGSRIYHTYHGQYDILAVSSKDMNILDKSAVDETISTFNPDYVIHCAAVAVTEYCNKNPEHCQAVNVEGTVNIAESCLNNKCRLVFLSTEQVFNGNTNSGPYSETDEPHPDTVYGQNKLDAENKIREICGDSLILRLTWFFGAPQKFQPAKGTILWDTIEKILFGKPFNVAVNEFRGLSYVDELMEQIPSLLHLPPGIFHTGSRNPMNRYESVCHIFKELGLEQRIEDLVRADYIKYSQSPRDIRLNTGKLRDAGIVFSETPDAISRCIRDYGISCSG